MEVIKLSGYSHEIDNVSWSCDNKIAVTTPDIIFICALRLPKDDTPQRPNMIVTTIAAPTSVSQSHEHKKFIHFVDPIYNGSTLSRDSFKRADWSPVGCSPVGSCLLSALTVTGQLLLYSPPSYARIGWSRSLSLTPQTTAHLSSVVAAFHWLPRVVDGCGFVALTTRSGHLFICKIKLGDNIESSIHWSGPLVETTDGSVWGCALKWSTSHTPLLAVSCTDGQVIQVSFSEPSLGKPALTKLWDSDNIPGYNMEFLGASVVVGKGSVLLILDGESHTIVSGYHQMPISGLCALTSDTLLSTSVDGRLQYCSRGDPRPHPLTPPITQQPPVSIQGLTTSVNKLLAAFTVQDRWSLSKRQLIYLYIYNLVSAPTGSILDCYSITIDTKSVWDIGECMRQMSEGNSPSNGGTPFDAMVAIIKQTDSLVSDQLKFATAAGQKSTVSADEAKKIILQRHAVNQLNELVAMETISLDPQEELTVKLMLSLLDREDSQQVDHDKVLSLCSSADPAPLPCVCQSPLVLNDLSTGYTCINRHYWDICQLSFQMVCSNKSIRVCISCGSSVNTSTSLKATKGGWLDKVLSQHTQCLFCGGHFETIC